MAEQALKRLEEQLNCSICLDTYTDPKLLQCFHVYCQQCLVPLVDRDQQGQLGLTCPTCRQVTPIPDRGVAGLPPAFHINHLLEIQASFQQLGNPVATPLEAATASKESLSVSSRYCFEHPEEELKLYCETCGELVCFQCIMRDGKHHDHEYALLQKAFEKYKDEITSSLEPMEKQVATAKKALAQIELCCEEISNQRAATAESVHSTFRRLQEVLNVRETELISKLDRIAQHKLKRLAIQKDQIETSLAQLCSCLHFMRESLGTSKEEDVLMMKPNTLQQVRELTTPFQPDFLEPNSKADIVFSTSTSIIAECQNYGKIVSLGLPYPPKCQLKNDVGVAAVGEMFTAILQTVNFEGNPCDVSIQSLRLELVSEITGTRGNCGVQRRRQGQYEISYQPTIKGRHHLHVIVEGRHVSGSPYSVAVSLRSSVEKLGTPILTIGGVREPIGLMINQRQEVVVTEWDGHCVSVFSPSGQRLHTLRTYGPQLEHFDRPHGVAIDQEGNVLVVDSKKQCIQKFTTEGHFVKMVGSKGSGPLQFDFPSDIASANDKLYVVDGNNHRIQVLNFDLTFCSTFGSTGSGKGQFSSPRGIACDSTGKVYVTDRGNNRIQVFTAEGKFLRMFGRRGQGRGELDWPNGIHIDTDHLVYVSEYGNHRISIFTSKGQFVTSFGMRGEGPGEFCNPFGVAVDDCGVVYVADCVNNRVQIF